MKTLKLVSAAALLFAAAGAYAGTDDGNVPAPQQKIELKAPAPVATGAPVDSKIIDSGIVSPTP